MFEQLSFYGSTYSDPYTVSQLTGHIRRLIDDDPALSDVWLEGEVSNFTRASSGHCYFTLKDAGAQIRCVMWRTDADRQNNLPTNGDLVISHGRVGVYTARGLYQLYVDQVRPAGVGDLYQQFERLKALLEEEGVFAPERKQPLPRLPRRIGVVTSPTAAALGDILNVLSRRFPLAEVLLSPTPVQGETAPPKIVTAIQALNKRDDADIIIVARGGGSLEELWAFNDEDVARTIAASRIPIVCGVGHETDFSLADFAADVRAPTPSAAAELTVPDQAEIRAKLEERGAAMTGTLSRSIRELQLRLADQVRALKRLSPAAQLVQARQRIDERTERAKKAVQHTLSLRRQHLDGLLGRLRGVSPIGTLERGYAIVRRSETHAVVHSVEDVVSGDRLGVRVADGEFEAEAM
ncbi:MAG: exodeoxyribonuclease VII large subunit [Anaerolineae bacterium]|jgi:exodeoxyribonuclease VII large subunit